MVNANINSPVKFWKSGGYGFDIAGLKFLFDPARMLNMNAGLDLGSNLVTNGDFHDFTMENDANVKGHWIFDSYRDGLEGGDGIENDWSGNSNDLTPNNFETDFEGSLTGSNPAYEDGNALEFDGVDQYLSIVAGSATDFDPLTGDFTYEAWIKTPSSFSGFEYIFSKYQGSEEYRCWVNNGVFYAQFKANGGSTFNINKTGALTVNTWYHVAVVHDRDGFMYLYVNGVEEDTVDMSVDVALSCNPTSARLSIGVISTLVNYFKGHIAEVRYSNKARTYVEIQQSYGAGKSWIPAEVDATTLYTNESWSQGIERVGGSDYIYQALNFEANELYRVEFMAAVADPGNNCRLVWDVGSFNLDTGYFDPGASFVKKVYYVRTNDIAGSIRMYGASAGEINSYNNVKVQKVQNILDADFTGSGTVKDYSPSGFHGQTINSLEDNQPAHPSGIELDGIADYMNFDDKLDFGTKDVLISTWLKVVDGTPASAAVIIGKYEDANNRFYLRLETDGDISIWCEDGGDNTVVATTTGAGLITADTWHHIAMVLDRDGDAYIYIDGVSKTVSTTTMTATDLNNAGDFRIGEYATAFTGMFIGLTTVYIYDGADGAPAALPADYATLIINIYNWGLNNRFGYGTDK